MPIKERTIVDQREEIARMAIDERFGVSETARHFGVSRPTVRLWRDRYREFGRSGLEDRSHATKTCRHRTSEEIEDLIVAERKRWGFGSKKILRRLEDAHPELEFPSRATIDAILDRRGFIERRVTKKRQGQAPFVRRWEPTESGDLTTLDHKAWFRLKNGQLCYPLTIADSFSRYLYACKAMACVAFEPTWKVITNVFREWGCPNAAQADNGPPFGPTHGRFSTMAVRLMMLNIQPVFSRPGKPMDNGRHERMHRELSAVTRKSARTMGAMQRALSGFQRTYNQERPHEALDQQRPARRVSASPRPFPRRSSPPEYEGHFERRTIDVSGRFSWADQPIFVSRAFRGQTIGLEPTDDGLWTVHFHRFVIGKFDERTSEFI